MISPRVAAIYRYPIKSLDGESLDSVELLENAGMQGDRQFAIVDEAGQLVHAKRSPLLHRVRSEVDIPSRSFQLRTSDSSVAGSWDSKEDRENLNAWLSACLDLPVSVAENDSGGFPDDLDANGPTLVGTESRRAVAEWFSLPVEEIQRRFRFNIEFETSEPFEEDGWLMAAGEPGCQIQIGSATLELVRACQRCVVPTRDSHTGAVGSLFSKQFSQSRETLPVETERSQFDHYYRFSLNTHVVEGGRISIGDTVRRLA